MECVRIFMRDNFMFFVLGGVLFLITSLGAWSNEKMSVSDNLQEGQYVALLAK